MVSTEARISVLKKIHLFRDLKDEQLQYLAELFDEADYKAGERIVEQGTRGESFFVIFKGRVRIYRQKDGREQQLAILVENDYFGEMELVSSRLRTAGVSAVTPVTVLFLSKENFNELLQEYPSLKPNLDVIIRSRALSRQLQFKWLGPDEVVYFLARKHPILLYEAMVAPVLVVIGAIILAVWTVLTGAITPAAVGGIVLVVDLGWAVWRAIDWSNDYYVVTNERVVWLEKVVGIYDSRQEAPLNTILSVGVETDLLGRAMDYGNVVVRTFVGRIPFHHVAHPYQAARVIEEYWQRAKQATSTTEKESMKNAIRAKLGLPLPEKPAETRLVPASAPKVTSRATILKMLGANTLKIRYELGDSVTYRKHWFVLIQQAGMPAFLIIVLAGLLIHRLFVLAFDPAASLLQWVDGKLTIDSLALLWPILMIPMFIWMIYQVIDWSNDIFTVTPDQIIDLDKTPFGTEQRSAAQLENILGTEYERVGILGNIFNFGTVYITVGGTQLAFENVADPATVQSDIDRRRMIRMAKVNESKTAAERERFADWLAAYSENADEFEHEPGDEPKTG